LGDAAGPVAKALSGLGGVWLSISYETETCLPRKARPGCATGADLLSNFAGLRVRSAKSGTPRPAFVKTRYSGLTGHDDGHHGDGEGLAAGEDQGA
jgi:hypothetical protein